MAWYMSQCESFWHLIFVTGATSIYIMHRIGKKKKQIYLYSKNGFSKYIFPSNFNRIDIPKIDCVFDKGNKIVATIFTFLHTRKSIVNSTRKKISQNLVLDVFLTK